VPRTRYRLIEPETSGLRFRRSEAAPEVAKHRVVARGRNGRLPGLQPELIVRQRNVPNPG